MDPDLGGANSYGPELLSDMEGNTYLPDTYTTSAPCSQSFKGLVKTALSDPEFLHALVAKDYADRWAGQEPPTLAECEAFCAEAVLEPDEEVACEQPLVP
jgi:hypothetical protein